MYNTAFSVKTNKAAVCIKGAKDVSKSLYNNPRWTLMPNFDLCQYYPTGNQTDFSRPKSPERVLASLLFEILQRHNAVNIWKSH